jgi:hypothetical protein
MRSLHCFALEILSVLLLSGCFSTTDVRTYRDISEALPHTIRIMALDTTIYELRRFSFTDSLVEGEGEHLVAGHWLPFSGELPMSRIVYIQSRSFNTFTSLVGLGLIGLTAAWFDEANAEEGLKVWRPYGGGGSCPYVYAWNGSRYVRQGEVFGTAFGKGMETSTGCVLPDASAPDGILRVRIADERPETHYINSVRVCAYEVPRGTSVHLDTRDRAWPLTSLLPPLRAPDGMMRSDNVRWKSDTLRPGGEYRDTLDLILPRTGHMKEGSLVVHAINTHLSEAAFETLFGSLGDESLPYLYRMEHDSGTVALLKGWIEECALHVDVWDGASWKSAGVIPPEANEVPFTRIVRIPGPEKSRDSVRIRLRVLADTWEIDDVEVDWSPALPLEEHVLPLLSARHSTRGSMELSLRSSDSDYAMLLPGEFIDMTFRPPEPRGGYAMTYACHASGYLYEWLPERQVTAELPEIFASSGLDRMNVVEYLLRDHDAFLPFLFARWDAMVRGSR